MKINGERQKVLFFKVVLSDDRGRVRGRPYRIIAAPGALSLHNLAEVVVESFNLEFSGSFGYYSGLRLQPDSEPAYDSRIGSAGEKSTRSARKVSAQELFQEVRHKMLLLFNRDNYFVIQLKRIDEIPRIVAWKGERTPDSSNRQ